jgi:hypothetical protein
MILETTARLQNYYMQANAFLRVHYRWPIHTINNKDGKLEDAVYNIMSRINGIR